MMKIACSECQSYSICKVREHFLSGKSNGRNEYISVITNDPDVYSQLHSGMDKLIGENCRYFIEEALD